VMEISLSGHQDIHDPALFRVPYPFLGSPFLRLCINAAAFFVYFFGRVPFPLSPPVELDARPTLSCRQSELTSHPTPRGS
jgi:hypothetical protein